MGEHKTLHYLSPKSGTSKIEIKGYAFVDDYGTCHVYLALYFLEAEMNYNTRLMLRRTIDGTVKLIPLHCFQFICFTVGVIETNLRPQLAIGYIQVNYSIGLRTNESILFNSIHLSIFYVTFNDSITVKRILQLLQSLKNDHAENHLMLSLIKHLYSSNKL